MESPSSGSVNVNVYLGSLRLEGSCAVKTSDRLSDLLGSQDNRFQIKHVSVTNLDGQRIDTYPELMVDKNRVLAIVPHEADDYIASRRMIRTGIATPRMASLPVGVVLPPFNAQGTLQMQAIMSMNTMITRLPRFFVLTDATVYLNRHAVEEDVTILVNRDQVAAIGPLEEARPFQNGLRGIEAARRGR